MSFFGTWNADFIDRQYQQWQTDPSQVSGEWRAFFEGFSLGAAKAPPPAAGLDTEAMLRQLRVERLIYRYRDLGHLLACLDPLEACPTSHPLLELSAFGLSPEDLEHEVFTRRYAKSGRIQLKELLKSLRATYCRSVGVEYMHLQDPDERRWLEERMEPVRNRPALSRDEKVRILERLYQAGFFEAFLHKRYLGQKRFSLEGADVIIPMLDILIRHAAAKGCRELVLGMSHRGRLNVQANILGKPYHDLFLEFEDGYDPHGVVGAGDVKYHKGYRTAIEPLAGHRLSVILADNPSHLESVDPVVQGMARARQDQTAEAPLDRVMPLLLHGDAAFAGQGIVAETLNMSQLEGYGTGGTVHMVINNQIGYTTLPADARSTRYSTDVAKMLMVPIFHVHGEDPEACAHVIRLAADYRFTFHKDVVIDVVCYRRYGHNEGDEPYFTQPAMYDRIRRRPPLYQLYRDRLIDEGVIDDKTAESAAAGVEERLEAEYGTAKESEAAPPGPAARQPYIVPESPSPATGISEERLLSLVRAVNRVPADFQMVSKLKRQFDRRREAAEKDGLIDWAHAELIAFASLLEEGVPVRLSGQDSRRGTFSQRHSTLVDPHTGRHHVPLNHLREGQAPFLAFDSLLSEAGVLGFEYGYSLARPQALTLWEAQFGDFINNAQAIVDLYIASGEAKWQALTSLVLLLPHGYEGQGPEHSSARPERFLQLCAQDNMRVVYPSTAAQYFHLLRRQVRHPVRKPLVVLTPKSLLRHPAAASPRVAFARETFRELLDDPHPPEKPRKVIFTSGKIYHQLAARRREKEADGIVLIRLEQLYPFPAAQLQERIRRYAGAEEWCWVQEEPRNMGAWHFIRPLLAETIGQKVGFIGRPALASTATGFAKISRLQEEKILAEAIGS